MTAAAWRPPSIERAIYETMPTQEREDNAGGWWPFIGRSAATRANGGHAPQSVAMTARRCQRQGRNPTREVKAGLSCPWVVHRRVSVCRLPSKLVLCATTALQMWFKWPVHGCVRHDQGATARP
eukprot:scaffold2417_cov174-Isochrysis_galbana.AAC.3